MSLFRKDSHAWNCFFPNVLTCWDVFFFYVVYVSCKSMHDQLCCRHSLEKSGNKTNYNPIMEAKSFGSVVKVNFFMMTTGWCSINTCFLYFATQMNKKSILHTLDSKTVSNILHVQAKPLLTDVDYPLSYS